MTKADCNTIIKNTLIADSNKVNALSFLQREVYSEERTSNNFSKLSEVGKQRGIVWNQVELLDTYYEEKAVNGVPRCEVFLSCFSGDKKFALMLPSCIKSDDAWVMRGLAKIHFE